MQQLLELRATEPRAALAIGIGEHAAPIRFEICRGLEHLGISLDDARNSTGAPIIGQGRCEVHVIRTDEERMIARHARRLVPSNGSQT